MKFRKERIDKSINMQCPKATPEPMKDISNRLNTAKAKLKAPLPVLIDEAAK